MDEQQSGRLDRILNWIGDVLKAAPWTSALVFAFLCAVLLGAAWALTEMGLVPTILAGLKP